VVPVASVFVRNEYAGCLGVFVVTHLFTLRQ